MKIGRTILAIGMVAVSGSAIVLAQTTASCTYTTFAYPGASSTYATGVNDYNTVVGYASLNGKQIGFIRWANGAFTKVDIGSIRTELFGRNNKASVSACMLMQMEGMRFFSPVAAIRTSTIPAHLPPSCSPSTITTV